MLKSNVTGQHIASYCLCGAVL